jgi:hypothetical protein
MRDPVCHVMYSTRSFSCWQKPATGPSPASLNLDRFQELEKLNLSDVCQWLGVSHPVLFDVFRHRTRQNIMEYLFSLTGSQQLSTNTATCR